MINRIIIFLLTCFLSANLFAQEKPPLEVEGKISNYVTGANVAGATVEVYEGATLIQTKTVGSGGKYALDKLPIDKKYKIVFKAPNFVSRYVMVDLSNIPMEEIPKKGFELPLDFTLVERFPNIDFSTLEPKITSTLKWSSSIADFDWNTGQRDTYKKELDKLLAKVQQDKDKIEQEKQAQEKKYTDAFAAAEAAFKANDFETAIKKYEEAKAAKPTAAAEIEKKLEVTRQKYKEFQGAEAMKKEYDAFMKTGNEKLAAKDYDNAIAAYKQALTKVPNDATANAKIKEAENGKKAEVDKSYNDYLARADKAFKEKDYGQAKNFYNEALKIKPTETLPGQKIKEIDDMIKKDQENETKYNQFIVNGNKDLLAKNYDAAIASFNEALKLRPGDAEATTGKTNATKAKEEATKDAAAKAAKEKEFNDLVAKADKEYSAKNYEAAIKMYDEALLKFDNPDVKKKKFDAEAAYKKYQEEQAAKLEAEKKKGEYDKFMSEGNSSFTAKDFDKAIASYNSAKSTGVNNAEADKKIKEATDAKIAAEKDAQAKKDAEKKKADFDAAIASGDSKLGSKDFTAAVSEYQKALALKVDDATANAKIKAANDAKIAAEKEAADKALAEANAKKKADFDAAIASGDSKLGSKDFAAAVIEYQKALAMKVDDATANAKIKAANDAKIAADKEAADKALAEANAKKKADFDAAIASGDSKLGSKDFAAAVSEYQKALALKVDDATANAKIKAANDAKIAADKEAADKALAEANAKKKADFEALIASGDSKLNAKDFDNSIAEYKKALATKFDDAAANAKITAATEAKAAFEKDKAAQADAAAKKKAYDEAIAKAQKDFDAGEFSAAIEKYNTALSYMPGDAFATGQIEKANAEIAKKKKFAEEQLAKLLEQADKDFDATNYADAKGYYERYLKQSPGHAHSTQRIKDCDAKIKEKEAEAANNKKKAEFDALITAGDSKLTAKDFDNSIAEYKKALATKFDDATATAKITAATEAKAAFEKEKASQADAAAKKKAYDEAIAKAQKDFDAGEFSAAIEKYNTALSYMPGDAFATSQIEKANAEIAKKKKFAEEQLAKLLEQADKDFDATNYADAKGYYERYLKQSPGHAHSTQRIKDCDAKIKEKEAEAANNKKKAEFDALITAGDSKLTAKDFDNSIAEYKKALAIKFDDATATAKITAATEAKAAFEKDKAAQADAATKKKAYDDAMAKGQKDFDAGDFTQAITDFELALTFLPGDAVATGQIAKAKEELEKKKKFAEEQLAKLLEQADKDFDATNYSDAKGYYERYLKQSPGHAHSTQRIKDCDAKIKEIEASAAEKARIEAKYKEFMSKGELAFKAKKYDEAISMYDGALGVKAGDADATTKKDQAIRAKEDLANAASAAETKKKYDAFIAKANGFFDAGDFTHSIDEYNNALTVIPADDYATKRIALAKERIEAKKKEVESMLAQLLSAADKEFDATNYSEAKGYYERFVKQRPDNTYAVNRIKECEAKIKELENSAAEKARLEAKYKEYMAAGEKAAAAKGYDDAIAQFNNALSVKAGDVTAQKRIDDMNKLKNDLFNMAKNQNAAKEKKLKYDAAIAEGNSQMTTGNFDAAIVAYREALGYIPEDKYATDQIKRCIKLKAEKEANAKKMYADIIAKADELFNAKNYVDAKDLYQRAQRFNPTDNYPPDQIKECDKQIALANRKDPGHFELNHQGEIVVNQSVLEGMQMIEAAKRQEKYLEEQQMVAVIGENQNMHSELQTDDIKESQNVQSEFNQEAFDREQKFKENDEYRLVKVDSTRVFVDVRDEAYRGALHQDNKDAYVRQDNFNAAAFYYDQLYKGKDEMREYKSDSMKFYKDYKDDVYRQTMKNNDQKNYVKQANFNEFEVYTEQLYKGKDEMREYKADSMKFYKDYKDDVYRQTMKNNDKNNYVKQANYNEFEFYTEQLYKDKDGMREYKADSMKFYKDYKDDVYRQTMKNNDKNNYVKQANFNEFEFYTEQLHKGKDEMREYKADSMKYYKDYKDDVYRQTMKNNDQKNYVKQANFNEFEVYTEQLYKEKDGMREYKADSVKFYKDYKDQVYRETMKNNDQKNYNKQGGFNEYEFQTEQLFKNKDEIRQESVREVNTNADSREAFVADVKKTNANATTDNNKDFIAEADNRYNFNQERSGNYIKSANEYVVANDNATAVNKEYKTEGDSRTLANNEKFKTTAPTVPKVYDTGHLSKLAQEYGEGVHQWTTHKYGTDKMVTEIVFRRIVVKGNTANDYMMTQNRWGVSYTKNGRIIGDHVWTVETAGNIIEHDK